MTLSPEAFRHALETLQPHEYIGRVSSLRGMMIEAEGLAQFTAIGDRGMLVTRYQTLLPVEVVGFRNHITLLLPYAELEGVGLGCEVRFVANSAPVIYPDHSWLGRVMNYHAEPIDAKGPLIKGARPYALKASPPPAHQRRRVTDKIDMGVRALNTFLTCCRGQRMGIFAGSGVGKSMLIAMLTRYAQLDVKVIGLIGERGREVQEFLHDYLGEEGLKKAVVVVATGDEMALARRHAAYVTMAISEYFRDQKLQVLCMIDSVTRFAMAQREIGLAAGEPPTTKGYTPTVFAELPKLLERAGPGTAEMGDITGLFSVLVEGDDTNEPIADTVRGVLDGHIVLDRALAERGHFPAINLLRSISRTMPGCNSRSETQMIQCARQMLSVYNDMVEMIRIGAYKAGSNREVDQAIAYMPQLEAFLQQAPSEVATLEEGYAALQKILAPLLPKDETTGVTDAPAAAVD